MTKFSNLYLGSKTLGSNFMKMVIFTVAIGLSLPMAATTSWAAKSTTKDKASKEKTGEATKQSAKFDLKEIKLNGSDGKDIVQVASDSKDHSTLVAAVKAADLVATLQGAGPYTIFAPTNSAFDKLPKGTVETLLKPENKEKLKAILEHHSAAPAYHPEILATLSEVDMVDGPKLKVAVRSGKIYVDDVEIKAAIRAQNGVIYVVDTVLLAK